MRSIIDRVVEEGDDALFEYALRFDGYKREFLQVSKEEIQAAYDKISQEDLEDLKAAHENITAFAEKQKEQLMLRQFTNRKVERLSARVDTTRIQLILIMVGSDNTGYVAGRHARTCSSMRSGQLP